MEDGKKKSLFSDEVVELKAKPLFSDEEVEISQKSTASPKSNAPSNTGGKSGAVTTPSTSTLPSAGSKSASSTQTTKPVVNQGVVAKPTAKQTFAPPSTSWTETANPLDSKFQNFKKTLPSNLKNTDESTYNLRGYWEGLGKPDKFDYSQKKEADGTYHASSRNPKTGEILKKPNHPTFNQALEEDAKMGYMPYISPDGTVYTFSKEDKIPSGFKPYKPTAKPVDAVQTNKIVEPKKTGEYKPLVQENIQKIEGMTMQTKFPEYLNLQKESNTQREAFDFKKASAEAVSQEQKAEKEQTLKRREERRVQNLPTEIEKLREERADLLLDKSPEAKKKVLANEFVTKKLQKEFDNLNKSKYENLQNLNQNAIKGIDLEINEYLQEDPKLKDKIKAVGLTDNELWDLSQRAIAKKTAPLLQDLQIFKDEGTIENASSMIKLSDDLRGKQEKMNKISDEMRSYETEYLNKTGFSGLNKEISAAKQKLDYYEPYLKKAKAEANIHKKELDELKNRADSFSTLIKDNTWLGTPAQLEELKAIEKEYDNTVQDFNNAYKSESLLGYDEALTNYNNLINTKNNLVSGLKSPKYQKMTDNLNALKLEYDFVYKDYEKFQDPNIKGRINQYFKTVQKVNEYDEKIKTTKGNLTSVEELEKAQEKFNKSGLGGDLLDVGGRAINSIFDASKKLIASPFSIASSFSDLAGTGRGTYHYSDWIADLILGTGSNELFLTKETNNIYDAKTDSFNLGFFPVLSAIADQAGIILTLGLTGKFALPILEQRMVTVGMDLTAVAEASKAAEFATTVVPAFMISYGDNYKQALSKGFTVEGAMSYSGALSLLEGLTEKLIPDQDLIFGKAAKDQLLSGFIKDFSKGKRFAIANLSKKVIYNGWGESVEENIGILGEVAATAAGSLTNEKIEIEIPKINQTISTNITSFVSGGGMGIFGSISEQSQMYKMGVISLANDFETGKSLLDVYKEKGKIDEKRYNKLISDAQNFQSVRGQIPQGLSGFKTMAIFEKMMAIKGLSAQMDKDETNPFNKINAKKISVIQGEIEQIVDDKNFDARAEYELTLESEELNRQLEQKPQEEKPQEEKPVELKKNTSPTNENYGTINRNDGKGVVSLTKEEFEAEQSNMQPKAEETAPVAEMTLDEKKTDLEKRRQEELKQADVGARLLYDWESSQPLDGTDEALADKMIEKIISKAKGTDDVHLKMQQLGWKMRGINAERFNQFIEDKIAGKTTKTFSEWRNEAKNNIDKVNTKYDAELAELNKATPKAKADGTAPIEEPLKDVDSTANALDNKVKSLPSTIELDRLPITNDATIDVSGNEKRISEAYHKAKADGSNPELVKAVEELLTPKTKTNEKANEDGEQKRGKDGEEDVTKILQGEGEIGGNEVDLKEKQVLAPEGAVTAAPIENPKVVIQGTRQGLETFESSNYDSKADGKVTDARGLKFDENGVSIQKDNKGNQIVHIKVDATDDFSRRGNLQVSVIVPEGTNVNTKAIKEIVDAKVAEIKAKGNIDLKLGKVQQSDFTALKDAIVNELKNPSAAKSKAEAVPNEEDINNKISVSGLREGYTVSRKTQEKTTKDSIQYTQTFDPRTPSGENSKDSFIKTIDDRGKKYRVVGLRMSNPKTVLNGQPDRSGMSYARIVDDGNLPSNIDELLIKKAIQEGKNLYEDIVKLEDSDFKMPSEYKPKAEAAPNVEASSAVVANQEVEADIKNRVVITGLDGGFKRFDVANSKNKGGGTADDVMIRDSNNKYEITYEDGTTRETIFQDIEYGKNKDSYSYRVKDKKTGEVFYVVGVSNRAKGKSLDSERNGILLASVKDDGNLPSNIKTLLELKLIKEFDIASKERKGVFAPLPQSFIDKVNAKYEAESKSKTKQQPIQEAPKTEAGSVGVDGEVDLNSVQKYTINKANKDLPQAKEIDKNIIDLKASGLDEELDLADVSKVQLLETRGRNSQGQAVGTVRIYSKNGSVENFEVKFQEAPNVEAGSVGVGGDVETYFNENTRSTQDSKYNPDLSGEGEMALREQENRLLELGADRIQAHGLAKGSIGQQFKDLINILTKGLDSRGGGQLYTAPLVMPTELRAGAGAALGTGGGTAYTDGGFIILAREGVNEIRSIDDIGGVLVNQAVADSLPELVDRLKKQFPNISIESYSNSPKAIESIKSKAVEQSLKETTITEEVEAVEGSTVKLPPSMKGGMERTMVFKDGEWQQSIGGSPTKVGDKVKAQADEAFKASQKAEPTVEAGGNVKGEDARKAMSKEIDSQVSAKENKLIEKQKQDIEKAKKDLEAINSGDKSVIDEYVKKSGYKLVTKEVIANNPKSELLKKSEGKYYNLTGASIQVKTAEQIAIDGASKKANSKPTGSKAGINQYVDAYNAITKFSEGKITAEEAKIIIEKAGLKIPKAVEQSLKEAPKTETTPTVEAGSVEEQNEKTVDNAIKNIKENGRPLSEFKVGDKVVWASDYSKFYKQYTEGVIVKVGEEYQIQRFSENPISKKYKEANFTKNTLVVPKLEGEAKYTGEENIYKDNKQEKTPVKKAPKTESTTTEDAKFDKSASDFNVGDIIRDANGTNFKVLNIGKQFTELQNLNDLAMPDRIDKYANVYKGFKKLNKSEAEARETVKEEEVVQEEQEQSPKKTKSEQIAEGLLNVLGIGTEGDDVKFSKTTGKPEVLTSQEEKEKQIIDQMNSMNLVNKGVDLNPSFTTKETIDLENLNARLKNPLESVNWGQFEGIPFGFTISDQLRTGDKVNPYTGTTIDNLKGGIGFNGTIGNENNAWANTDEKSSNSMHSKGLAIYNRNKPFFEKLWSEGKLPSGHIPFAVVKMAESSIISNEAIRRVGIDNLNNLPAKNRKAAAEALKSELERKKAQELENLNRGTKLKKVKGTPKGVTEYIDTKIPYSKNTKKGKEKLIKQYENILKEIEKNNFDDIVDILEDVKDFSLPQKAIIFNEIFYGEPNKIGEASAKAGTPSTLVSKTLVEGLDKSKRELINIGFITDFLTEESMKNVPNMHIISIIGVKVAENKKGKWVKAGGRTSVNHPNYEHGVEGQSIGILTQPIHMKDAFGEAYASALGQVIKNETKKASISIDKALTQGIPVQAGLPNRVLVSAIAKEELDAVDKLAGFLRQAFPNTTFFTSQDAWDAAMEDPSIKKKLKDGDVVYAFTTDGNVFINPTLKTTKATLHESGHIWMGFVKKNNPALHEKGLSLVDGTKEYQKAKEEYGDTELAREEALMELMSSKGDTIVNAAQKAKFKEWLLSVYKYIADNFTSLLGLSPKQVENLTLDKFLDGMLADLLSGKELTTKKIKGETKFSKQSQNSQIKDYIESQRAAGESDADIRAGIELVADRIGLTEQDINDLMSKEKAIDTQAADKQNLLNSPKSAKDVATIFRNLFNFSPQQSVFAARMFDAKAAFMANVKGISKEDYYKEYWFQDGKESQKGNWTKEAEKMKRIISMYEKADSTTVVHEIIGHDYLDRIIEASATNKEFEADLRTIAEEYAKERGGKVEDIIKALKDFDVESNPSLEGRKIHEWFATQAEQYFATEKDVKSETPQQSKMAKIFEAFRQQLADLYDKMNKALIAPSDPMKKVFRKVFGEENFNLAEKIRESSEKEIIDIGASALEQNKKEGGLKRLEEKLKAKGLAQSEYHQDIYDAANEMIANGDAKRYNVTDKLKKLYPAIEKDIEDMRRILQGIGVEKKNLRGGAENLLANQFISDEAKEKISKFSEYTPETFKELGLKADAIIDFYIGENGLKDGMDKLYTDLKGGDFANSTEEVVLQQSLIGMYNKLAASKVDANTKKMALERTVDIAETYSKQGTKMGQAINAYRLLGALTAEGRVVWSQRQVKKYVKPAYEGLKTEINKLKAELKDAYKQVDYFFEQTLGREETEGQYNELIAQYQAEIDALKSRKPREPKASKPAYKGVKVNRAFKESDLANFAKDILEGGLFQDMETMTAPQKLAYGIMEKKPINISEFAKEFSKYLGKKIDPKEVQDLYKQTRDLLIGKDLAFSEGLSSNEQVSADLAGLEEANKAKIEELERKKADTEAKRAAKIEKDKIDNLQKELQDLQNGIITDKKGNKRKAESKDVVELRQKISDLKKKLVEDKAKQAAAEAYQKELQTLNETKEKLANAIVNDAKGAEGLLPPKKVEYLNELLKAVKGKINEMYPDQVKQPADPYKDVMFAINALNDSNSEKLFEGAKDIVTDKIENDSNLTDAEKQDLKNFVSNYQQFIFDQVLSKGAASKAVQQALKDTGYTTPSGTIDWNRILYWYRKDPNIIRNDVKSWLETKTGNPMASSVQGRVLDALMDSYDVKVNEANKRYYESNPKPYVNMTQSDASDKLSNFVLDDLKKAIKGTIPKQKTYLDELLKALKEKVGDIVKKESNGKIQTAKLSEVEAIKFALDRVNNGRIDANIWNDAVEQVKAKIKGDNTLSQADKDNLTQYLDEYTNFIYDNLLSENQIFKVIKEKLIQSGYGNGNIVNWKKIITGANGDVNAMREIIQKLVGNQLKDYNNAQVDGVLDAIVRKYDQEINKKRKEIADDYIANSLDGTKSQKKKTQAVQGKIGKLLVENRLGILENESTDILNELAKAKGLSVMTTEDWAKISELSQNVENSAEGNLKNKALEELTAFVASKQPLYSLKVLGDIRFAVLLGRPLTWAVNLWSNAGEGATAALGRTIRGDFNFIKDSKSGLTKGGFNDILLGGGVNQASKASVEVNNTGMPYFRALESYEGKLRKYIRSGKYVPRILDSTDSVFQEMFSSAYDRTYLEKFLKLENPNATKAEIDKMVNDVLSKNTYDDFYAQALQDVIKSGQKPTRANVKRRTYEILRESRMPEDVRAMADLEAREGTFKSEWTENRGLATAFGQGVQLVSGISRFFVESPAKKIFISRGYSETQAEELAKLVGGIIPNKILPFSRGIFNVIEKGMEKELIYGLTKAAYKKFGIENMPTTNIGEKLAKERAKEKVNSLISQAVVSGAIMYGVGAALYALSKSWDEDKEEEALAAIKRGEIPKYYSKTKIKGIQSDKQVVSGASSVKEKTDGEDVVTLFGQDIPLKWFAGQGIALRIDVNLYEAFAEEQDPSKVRDSELNKFGSKALRASAKITESFMQQSYLMSQNEKQSLMVEMAKGNTEAAQNIMLNDMISYGGSYLLWSGFLNQALQSGRYLSGDKTYQEAKTLSEKVQKQLGFAGLTYENTKPNFMGEPLLATEVNREGVQGFLGMFSKTEKSPIKNWIDEIGYKDIVAGRKNKSLAAIDTESFVTPTVEEYDKFSEETRKMIGTGLTKAYELKDNIKIPLNENGLGIKNKNTGRPYTKNEWTLKVLNDINNSIEAYNRVMLVNKIDENKYEGDEYKNALIEAETEIQNAFYNLTPSYYTEEDRYIKAEKIKNSIISPKK